MSETPWPQPLNSTKHLQFVKKVYGPYPLVGMTTIAVSGNGGIPISSAICRPLTPVFYPAFKIP
jgi:hypothetical protein